MRCGGGVKRPTDIFAERAEPAPSTGRNATGSNVCTTPQKLSALRTSRRGLILANSEKPEKGFQRGL
jgi:hypothetical protein